MVGYISYLKGCTLTMGHLVYNIMSNTPHCRCADCCCWVTVLGRDVLWSGALLTTTADSWSNRAELAPHLLPPCFEPPLLSPGGMMCARTRYIWEPTNPTGGIFKCLFFFITALFLFKVSPPPPQPHFSGAVVTWGTTTKAPQKIAPVIFKCIHHYCRTKMTIINK